MSRVARNRYNEIVNLFHKAKTQKIIKQLNWDLIT
jgi:hypothetical protein